MATPGFQGSETTSADVTVYSHGHDTLNLFRPGVVECTGLHERATSPAVLNVRTSKQLGTPAGTFEVALHLPHDPSWPLDGEIGPFNDDDWVDIVLRRHARAYHTMRGLITDMRITESVGGTGATSSVVSLSGKDFGSIYDRTKIWFNTFAGEIALQEAALLFDGVDNRGGTPSETTRKILLGFIDVLSQKGRGNWLLPPGMPGAAETFAETFLWNDEKFSNTPDRFSVSPQFLDPEGEGVWAMAKEWSDPLFCEVFTDLARGDGKPLLPDLQSTPRDTAMVTFFRDKPFPHLVEDVRGAGIAGPWFRLPTAIVYPQEIGSKSIGRGGLERYNTFMANSTVVQELGGFMHLQRPLWDAEDVRRHGMREFVVKSPYTAHASDLLTYAETSRELARDWYCLNPYLLSGTLNLKVLRPDIRVGMRVRIPGHTPELDTAFYVEEVTHSWALNASNTVLGVTRGWVGTDQEYMAALYKARSKYALVEAAIDTGVALV